MLCRQVWRALTYALAGSADDAIRTLSVASVLPAPDAGHLLVTVVPGGAGDLAPSLVDLLERLDRARPWLRREVAEAIVRKRAPELTFRVAAAGEEVQP
jgi:ribosome-binding factor A